MWIDSLNTITNYAALHMLGEMQQTIFVPGMNIQNMVNGFFIAVSKTPMYL